MSGTGGAAPGTSDESGADPRAAPDPATVVREHLRAFNAGDLPALLDGFTPEAVWVTGRSSARGRVELAELFGRAMADLRPTLTLRALVATDRLVACEPTEVLTSGGRQHTYPIACFYEIAAGRIAAPGSTARAAPRSPEPAAGADARTYSGPPDPRPPDPGLSGSGDAPPGSLPAPSLSARLRVGVEDAEQGLAFIRLRPGHREPDR